MLSSAQVKVKELQQSVNLVTNESKKLEVISLAQLVVTGSLFSQLEPQSLPFLFS